MNTPLRFALLALVTLSAGGCTLIEGDDPAAGVDRSIVTGSISPRAAPPDREALSDSRTVRNAVSAADLSAIDRQPLAWTNIDTGASGAVTQITERRHGTQTCRAFITSRQRFDGVHLFDGEACTRGDGEWTLTRFSPGN